MSEEKKSNKGFTLIELLVVIAIIAILAVVAILTLNPVELIKQARDSNRISDLSTLKTALSIYLTDVANINLASSSPGFTACYLSTVSGNGTGTAKCSVFSGSGITVNSSTTAPLLKKIDSTGWVPVNFSQISAGTPFGTLPIDPTNNQNFYYAYAASTTLFEIDAFMESSKYSASGTKDVVSTDGGDTNKAYEVGNSLIL